MLRIFLYLYCKFIFALRKLAKRNTFTVLYETKVGVKNLYSIFDPVFQTEDENVIYVRASELYLDFDALRDKYTLCDVPLGKSPHLDFLKKIDAGIDIRETDYIRRVERGTIDMRPPRFVNNNMLTFFKAKFKERKEEVSTGNYRPVSIYVMNGKYYIADGKHRAAMCALLGVDVKCIIIGNRYLEDSFYQWVCKKMLQNPSQYNKNISFFERFNNQ